MSRPQRRPIQPLGEIVRPAALAAHLGPVVYFARWPDGTIKIGCTSDLARRRRALSLAWSDILAVVPGSFREEHALHVRLAAHRAHHREYFHQSPEVLAVINEVRDRLGVPVLTSA